jgi:hypothetical protein
VQTPSLDGAPSGRTDAENYRKLDKKESGKPDKTKATDARRRARLPLPKNTDLLDDPAATAFLGLAPGTLAVWRSTGRYRLPFLKVGRSVRYRRSALEAFLAERTREVTA